MKVSERQDELIGYALRKMCPRRHGEEAVYCWMEVQRRTHRRLNLDSAAIMKPLLKGLTPQAKFDWFLGLDNIVEQAIAERGARHC